MGKYTTITAKEWKACHIAVISNTYDSRVQYVSLLCGRSHMEFWRQGLKGKSLSLIDVEFIMKHAKKPACKNCMKQLKDLKKKERAKR